MPTFTESKFINDTKPGASTTIFSKEYSRSSDRLIKSLGYHAVLFIIKQRPSF